ncbi:MAG: gliding motility protein GldN [Cytophagaceae bacterium]|nr:gliding motility protein GldN [Cytophagaceae bacterium]|tara:strand:- start:2682 stop:3575 length:894 start_codon:yes stop_codon:yes gene_type:complete
MSPKFYLFGALFLLLGGASSFAQENILNAKTPDEMFEKTAEQKRLDNDKPLPYGYVDSRDVLWGKNVWEVVDLDERVNFPLYYPIDTNNIGSDRRSLYDVLVKNAKAGNIDMYSDSYFNKKIELKDIQAALAKVDTTDAGRRQFNAEGRVDAQYIDRRDISAADIEQYLIRGYWYFDKRQGELKYRLLGIAPVSPDVNFIDEESDQVLVPLFWVWFPGARDVLHEAKVFNPQNSAQPITFDHLLNSRRFNGLIIRVDNVQGDRAVKEYITQNSMMQLLESERLKEQIRNFEMDMWNY